MGAYVDLKTTIATKHLMAEATFVLEKWIISSVLLSRKGCTTGLGRLSSYKESKKKYMFSHWAIWKFTGKWYVLRLNWDSVALRDLIIVWWGCLIRAHFRPGHVLHDVNEYTCCNLYLYPLQQGVADRKISAWWKSSWGPFSVIEWDLSG